MANSLGVARLTQHLNGLIKSMSYTPTTMIGTTPTDFMSY